MPIQMVPQSVWRVIQNDVEIYVESSKEEAEAWRKKILLKLNKFIKTYPKSIDLLATKADYLTRKSQREEYLLKAYSMAKRYGDVKNQTLISSSLAILYIEELEDFIKGGVWISKLRDALLNHFDQEEKKTLEELEMKLLLAGSGSAEA